MCRHSGDHPYSRSQAQAGFASGSWYPLLPVSYIAYGELFCGSYFEGKMLEEMCGAIGLVCFGSASSINPHPNRRCLRPG